MKEEGNQENKEIFEYLNSFREKTIKAGVEQIVTDAIGAGDLSNRFPRDFIIKVVAHLFLHYTEIFGMDEDYEESKFLDDMNNFIDFLKYGFGK